MPIQNAPLPYGISDFKKIIEGNYLYIDKTLFIYSLITNRTSCEIIQEPSSSRSTLISMLRYFLGIEGAKNQSLFIGLDITRPPYRAFCQEHQGKYPVVVLDFNSLCREGDDDQTVFHNLREWLYQLGCKASIDSRRLAEIKNDPHLIVHSILNQIFLALAKTHGKKVFFILDNADRLLIQGHRYGNLEKMDHILLSILIALKRSGTEWGIQQSIIFSNFFPLAGDVPSNFNHFYRRRFFDNRYRQFFYFNAQELKKFRPYCTDEMAYRKFKKSHQLAFPVPTRQTLYNPKALVYSLLNKQDSFCSAASLRALAHIADTVIFDLQEQLIKPGSASNSIESTFLNNEGYFKLHCPNPDRGIALLSYCFLGVLLPEYDYNSEIITARIANEFQKNLWIQVVQQPWPHRIRHKYQTKSLGLGSNETNPLKKSLNLRETSSKEQAISTICQFFHEDLIKLRDILILVILFNKPSEKSYDFIKIISAAIGDKNILAFEESLYTLISEHPVYKRTLLNCIFQKILLLPLTEQEMLQTANAFQVWGEFEAAITFYNKLLNSDYAASAYCNKAVALYQLGEDPLPCLSKAHKAMPKCALILKNLVKFYMELQQWQIAGWYLAKANKLTPADAEIKMLKKGVERHIPAVPQGNFLLFNLFGKKERCAESNIANPTSCFSC